MITQNIEPLKIFNGKKIYADSKDKDAINIEVDKIMTYYKQEVETYNRRLKRVFFLVNQKNPLSQKKTVC